MEKTLTIINQMHNEGVFSSYAIGGAIAALFYIEPMVTFDLDVFILLPESDKPLISLTPVYEWLEIKGFFPKYEHIYIEDIPVQFIPAYNDLVTEAVEKAVIKDYNKIKIRVIQPEYLLAIMIQTFRPKDIERMKKFLENKIIQEDILNGILEKHGLKVRYMEFLKV